MKWKEDAGRKQRTSRERVLCSLEELEAFDNSTVAGEEDLEVILGYRRPVERGRPEPSVL